MGMGMEVLQEEELQIPDPSLPGLREGESLAHHPRAEEPSVGKGQEGSPPYRDAGSHSPSVGSPDPRPSPLQGRWSIGGKEEALSGRGGKGTALPRAYPQPGREGILEGRDKPKGAQKEGDGLLSRGEDRRQAHGLPSAGFGRVWPQSGGRAKVPIQQKKPSTLAQEVTKEDLVLPGEGLGGVHEGKETRAQGQGLGQGGAKAGEKPYPLGPKEEGVEIVGLIGRPQEAEVAHRHVGVAGHKGDGMQRGKGRRGWQRREGRDHRQAESHPSGGTASKGHQAPSPPRLPSTAQEQQKGKSQPPRFPQGPKAVAAIEEFHCSQS